LIRKQTKTKVNHTSESLQKKQQWVLGGFWGGVVFVWFFLFVCLFFWGWEGCQFLWYMLFHLILLIHQKVLLLLLPWCYHGSRTWYVGEVLITKAPTRTSEINSK